MSKDFLKPDKYMKNIKSFIAVVALLLFVGSDAFAANINTRQANQQLRITQGIASGELTTREAIRLQKGQLELNRMERKAKRDGKVTKKERAVLHAKADKESAKIHRNKHDQQSRIL